MKAEWFARWFFYACVCFSVWLLAASRGVEEGLEEGRQQRLDLAGELLECRLAEAFPEGEPPPPQERRTWEL